MNSLTQVRNEAKTEEEQQERMEMEHGVLGEDILTEILSRCPKKSLTRFKCVCKRWCHLISDRSRLSPKTTDTGLLFKRLATLIETSLHMTFRHLRLLEPSPMTFLRLIDGDDGSAASIVHSLGFDLETRHSVIDSCNGLLLLQVGCVSLGHRPFPMSYLVYNPSTKHSVGVPLPPTGSRNANRVGFAFDGKNHYQVVRFRHTYNAETLEFEIFSSQTGEWSEKSFAISHPSGFFHAPPPIYSSQSLFLKGAVHWVLGNSLLIYHLKDEFFELTELPVCDDCGFSFDECIWNSEGCLNYCKGDENGIRIWALHMGGLYSHEFRWQLKHEVVLTTPKSKRSDTFKPCAFNDDFETVYLIHERRVFSYKLGTGVLKEVCINPPFEASNDECISAVYPFLYTLVDSL